MKTLLAFGFVVAALGVACRGTLPVGEPPKASPSPDGAPSLLANDPPSAGPGADDNLASPPDTLPGPNNPAGIAEPTDKGTIKTTDGTAGSSAH